MTHRIVSRRPFNRLSILLTVALAGACGGAGLSPSTPVGSSPATTSAPASVPVPGATVAPSGTAMAEPTDGQSPAATGGDATELEIVAKDFAYEGPTSVPAGPVSIKLKNEGQVDHQAQIARIAAGATFEDLVAALAQPDPTAAFGLITFVGGPSGVPAGEEQVVTSVLEPGTHVLLCFYAEDDGIPHLAKGMVAQLEVTEPAAGGELPAGGTQLTLQDFAFVGITTVPAGEQVVRVTNSGPQPHEATIIRLAEGTTVDQIFGMMTASPAPTGPPPFENAGGIGGLGQGLEGTMTLDLEPGDYAFICNIPDAATGKSHAELGMIGGFTVQ